MKDFIKHTLATVVGIFLFGIITCILMLMSIVGMMASNSQTKTIDDNSVLVIKLKGIIDDKTNDEGNPLATLLGEEVETQGLYNLVEAIKRAKQSDEIKGK